MIIRSYIGFICVLVSTITSYAQDASFLQMSRMDASFTPAFTIADNDSQYAGSLTAKYRSQWNALNNGSGFSSFFLSYDHIIKFNQWDYWNIGAAFLNDKSAGNHINQNTFQFFGSYTSQLTSNQNNTNAWLLSAGISGSYHMQQSDIGDIWFGNQFDWNSIQVDQSLPSGESNLIDNNNYLSLAAGLSTRYRLSKYKSFSAGISVYHVNQPVMSWFGQDLFLNRRMNIYLTAALPLTRQIQHKPAIYMITQGPYVIIMPSYMLKFDVNGDDSSVSAGLTARVSNGLSNYNFNTLIFHFGISTSKWIASLNYELNISELNTANGRNGGFELSFSYLIINP